jgi:hypothetical protein
MAACGRYTFGANVWSDSEITSPITIINTNKEQFRICPRIFPRYEGHFFMPFIQNIRGKIKSEGGQGYFTT